MDEDDERGRHKLSVDSQIFCGVRRSLAVASILESHSKNGESRDFPTRMNDVKMSRRERKADPAARRPERLEDRADRVRFQVAVPNTKREWVGGREKKESLKEDSDRHGSPAA